MDTATGSDLNPGIGGTGSSSTTPGTNDYTSTGGNFDGTSVFTPTDSSTPASTIAVGDYVSLYNTGDTVARCVAKVVTVAAGVNGAVTIDTTIRYGTVPTSNSGSRALKHGGPWATFGIGGASTTALGSGTAPQSTQVNIKAGTYTNTTTARTVLMVGTTVIPLIFSGYKATINDQDTNLLAVPGTDIPTDTFTTVGFTGAAFQTYRNISWTSARTNGATINFGANCTFSNCQIVATGANSASLAIADNTQTVVAFIGCYINATSSAALSNTANFRAFIGCYLKGGTNGIVCAAALAHQFLYNVFDSQGGDCIQFTTGYGFIIGNSFYGPTGNGIVWSGTPSSGSMIVNNYFENVNQASKAAINNNSGTNTSLIRAIGNAYFNCTSTVLGLGDYPEFFSGGTLASAGFTSGSTQDFTPTSTLRGIGFPAHAPTLSPTNYPTPGAYASQASGTTYIFQVDS